jgi:DNA-binding beta-propeller fold protein YncE
MNKFFSPIACLGIGAFWLVLTLSGCSESNQTGGPGTVSPTLAMSTPVRVTGTSEGLVLVSDYDKSAVLKLDPVDLRITGTISVSGRPTGLARAGNEVFVGNESKGNVEVYALDSGGYLRRLGGADHLFGLPNGIAIDAAQGMVFVVDSVARVVKQFNLDGSSAGADIGGGLLAGPTALIVDAVNQLLYVSDYGAPTSAFGDTPSIQILNYAGVLVARIEGTTWNFDRPQGLALNGSGKLFVAEGVAGLVLVFDVTNPLSVVSFPSIGSGALNMPLDVYIDPRNNDLFVTSSLNSEVVVYRGGGA